MVLGRGGGPRGSLTKERMEGKGRVLPDAWGGWGFLGWFGVGCVGLCWFGVLVFFGCWVCFVCFFLGVGGGFGVGGVGVVWVVVWWGGVWRRVL